MYSTQQANTITKLKKKYSRKRVEHYIYVVLIVFVVFITF